MEDAFSIPDAATMIPCLASIPVSLLQCPEHFGHRLLSLLTCRRPPDSPPLLPRFRNRQLLYHNPLYLPPFLPMFFLPAFLVLKRLHCQYQSRFSLSHPPHRSTLSLSISLTGPNTVHPLTLCYTPFPFLARMIQPPKDALPSPSTPPLSPPRSSLRIPSYR